jgi:hypothetical protein
MDDDAFGAAELMGLGLARASISGEDLMMWSQHIEIGARIQT